MTAEQILRAAQDTHPEVFSKMAHALRILEKIDPDSHQETVGEFGQIAGFASGEIEKTATMRDAALVAGAGVLTALGSAVAMDLYDAAKRGLSKGVNYKRVMEANPELRRLNKNKVRTAFDTLHRYGGPEFSADPMVAGAIVKHLSELPEFGPETAMKLIASRKLMTDTRKNQFSMDPKTMSIGSAFARAEGDQTSPKPKSRP